MRALYFAAALAIASTAAAEPTLVGYARLPADTFRRGPTSGQFIEGANGRLPPFVDQQPVQGISSVVATDTPGTYLALSDNGFGAKANSADYVLCVYEVTPDFETGEVAWSLAFELSDPDRKAGFPIVADLETYPGSEIPVPAEIRENRLLTGADFDVESMVRLPDGTFWVGDEFGPFLLHFDAQGRLMEEPVGLPGEGMHSPDHPTKDPEAAKIGRSGGFEGLGAASLRRGAAGVFTLWPMLEKPLDGESGLVQAMVVNDGTAPVELLLGAVPNYPLPADAVAIGETTVLADHQRFGFLVIERDSEQGPASRVKRIAWGRPGSHALGRSRDVTTWQRKAISDLLDLADPRDLNGDGRDRFAFPYLTIESVLPVDDRTVLVVNDNNYPFTDGRPERDGPDDTEFILIRFDRPLAELGEVRNEARP